MQSVSVIGTFAAGVVAATASAPRLPAPLRRLPPVSCLGLAYASLLWAKARTEAPTDDGGESCVLDDAFFTTCT
eukprot:3341339-Prymnesium_polylepis.2